jgi:phosphatidate phosphatase APP1
MLYVSRAPWGIYDVLDTFFAQHRIPAGPVLFLREWGVSWAWPFPRKAEDHKRDLINSMLALYKDLPAILIGDSGQHDPEIYRQTVLEHPGRIRAVYIRNVSRRAERIGEIEELARAVVAAGSSLVLAVDSLVIAEHAAKLGLIAPEAVSSVRGDVARDRVEESNVPPSSPAQRVEPEDLGRVLGAGPEPASANVEVEPGPDRRTLAQPSSGGTPG